jgi:hypothetical protein
MKHLLIIALSCLAFNFAMAQNPVGKWKIISHISSYGGETFDSHKALLQQRPCAAKIFWEINTDGTYRQNTAASGCDERYRKIQEKLYSKTNWKVVGNKITISTQKDFSIGQTYTFTISGNKMVWTGTEGQGVITFQKL